MSETFHMHQVVQLRRPHPADAAIPAGSIGAIVHIYDDGAAAEVEFTGRVRTCAFDMLEAVSLPDPPTAVSASGVVLRILMDCHGVYPPNGDEELFDCEYALLELDQELMDAIRQRAATAGLLKQADSSFTMVEFNDTSVEAYSHMLQSLLEHALTEEEYEEFESDDWYIVPSGLDLSTCGTTRIEFETMRVSLTDRGVAYVSWRFYPDDVGCPVWTTQLPVETLQRLFDQAAESATPPAAAPAAPQEDQVTLPQARDIQLYGN